MSVEELFVILMIIYFVFILGASFIFILTTLFHLLFKERRKT